MNIVLYQRQPTVGSAVGTVLASLREAGHRVYKANDGTADNWRDADLLWIQGNANWFPRACRWIERLGMKRPQVVIWHTEPLPPRLGSGLKSSRLHLREIAKILLRDKRASDPFTNAARIRRLWRFGLPDVLVVSSRSRQGYLTAQGIQSHFIPLGYRVEAHGRMLGHSRDIDVLFLGTMQVPRRRRLVNRLCRAGVEVRTEGSWNDSRFWGENRTQLLNRTKILLNLQRHPGEFSGVRMILGMSNGALIISEPIDQPEPYIPGRHYVETPIEQMPAVIRHYLEHTSERGQITAEAYRFVAEELTMRAAVEQVLELARDLSGHPVNRVVTPLGSGS